MSKTMNDPIDTSSLFEAAVSGRWNELDSLLDDYQSTSAVAAVGHDDDTTLTSNNNPLFAAILHTAILMARKRKSTCLFGDAVSNEMLASVNGANSSEGRVTLTADDFCPYSSFNDGDDERSNRMRRKVIAKMCRVNPLWISSPLLLSNNTNNNPTATSSGPTPLHLAVRMRNPSLIKLLLKHSFQSSTIPDNHGHLPLHYAIYPPDTLDLHRKALAMHASRTNTNVNSLIGPADLHNIHNLDSGGGAAGGVGYGMRMVHRARVLVVAVEEMAMVGRYRVKKCGESKRFFALQRQIYWKVQLQSVGHQLATSAQIVTGQPEANSASVITKPPQAAPTKQSPKITQTSQPNEKSADKTNIKPPAASTPQRRSTRIQQNDHMTKTKTKQYLLFSNLYSSPSSLVRAIMFLGCLDDELEFMEAESSVCNSVEGVRYPNMKFKHFHWTVGTKWKTEQHRIDSIKMLVEAYPAGMSMSCHHDEKESRLCGGGGDTPFIMAVRTFKGALPGEEDDDEDFDMELMGLEGDGQANGQGGAAGDGNGDAEENVNDMGVGNADGAGPANENVVEGRGEEEADYEADLPEENQVNGDLEKKQSATDSAERTSHEETTLNAQPPQENAADPAPALPDENNQQEEPNQDNSLQAIRIMINTALANNDHSALLTPNDDGDTPLHMATRIGAHRRLITLLLTAQPQASSIPANDAATPLHLLLRRCSHLAPEGVGGLATYDSEMVQLMLDNTDSHVMSLRNSDQRTPLHEAAYFGASPEVLDTLCNADGGREALLLRDGEGHTPLGAYCRHAADFYGMRVLVNHCPSAAATLGDGRRFPLHRVLASFNLAVNVDVLNLLGTAYPRGIDFRDSHGMTPLALLCMSYRGPMNVDLPKLMANRTTLGRCLSNKVMLMARYLLFAGKANREWNQNQMNKSQDNAKPKERLLHATLRDPATTEEIVQLAMLIDSTQLQEKDEDGNTPLHLCCFRESGFTSNYKEEGPSECEDDDVFKSVNEGIQIIDESPTPLETSEGSGRRTLVEGGYSPTASFIPILHSVLKRDPAAARVRNNTGQFPFNILVNRGATWGGGGVDQVFKANPAAIFSVKLSNAIVVMAMGRVARVSERRLGEMKEEQAACLGSMFELLRGKPTVLEGAKSEMLNDSRVMKQRATRRSKRLRTH